MFPDYRAIIYAREDMLNDIPQGVLNQFSDIIVINRPEDCAS